MNKAICENFQRCNCERCVKFLKNIEDGCQVCKVDNPINAPCENAKKFVAQGLLDEFERH